MTALVYTSLGLLDLYRPDPSLIALDDIQEGLERRIRWGCVGNQRLSVANHSVLVSLIVEARGASKATAIAALLHDAFEAYAGDVPAPLKKSLGQVWTDVEENFIDVVWAKFCDGPIDTEAICEADDYVARIEMRDLGIERTDAPWSRMSRVNTHSGIFAQRRKELGL
jgi:hypothetical protein